MMKPRLCFIGPMLGSNPGYIVAQAETLAARFISAGYLVTIASAYPHKLRRLVDVVETILRHGRVTDIQCLQVYGGLSFVAEDIASWLARRFGQRIVMTLRGGAMSEFAAAHPRWVRRVLRRADAIVTPSAFLARWLSEFGFKAEIIPNLINLESYPYRCRDRMLPRLFWMRSFHPVYNPEMAVRVIARVRQQMPQARLVIAGQDKGSRAQTQSLAMSLGVEDGTTFYDFLDMTAKVRLGGEADIYLNTNRVDNMPVTIIEAWAMGLPVVATQVGGIPDMIQHGETGLLVPNEDHEAMADAVLDLVRRPELAARLSANGRKQAEQSCWENVHVAWENLFRQVLEINR